MEDLHARWPHRWVTKKAHSFNSPISGLGLVASEDIEKGEPVLVTGGVIVPKSEILEYRKMLGHVGGQISDSFFICPTSKDEFIKAGGLNHSCEPNAGYANSQIEIIAIKKIAKGQEIAIDYAFMETDFEAFKCNCGSKNCRKTITQDDWKLSSIQKLYKNYYSPYLKSKIDSRA